MVWFGLNIGRQKNADPRWLLPLICRVGEISKREIGSIRVDETESRFEILAEHADNFANAVKISKHREGRIWRIGEEAAEAEGSGGAARSSTAGPAEPAQHARREYREDRAPGAAANAGFAPRKFKPNSRKPGPVERNRSERHAPRQADASGGNGTLKRSWKDKKRQS